MHVKSIRGKELLEVYTHTKNLAFYGRKNRVKMGVKTKVYIKPGINVCVCIGGLVYRKSLQDKKIECIRFVYGVYRIHGKMSRKCYEMSRKCYVLGGKWEKTYANPLTIR